MCAVDPEVDLAQIEARCALGLVEKVGAKAFVGVEDFDADEAVVFPVEGDEPGDAGRERGRGGGAAGLEFALGEVDIGRVGVAVVGDPHASIVLAWSARSCQ